MIQSQYTMKLHPFSNKSLATKLFLPPFLECWLYSEEYDYSFPPRNKTTTKEQLHRKDLQQLLNQRGIFFYGRNGTCPFTQIGMKWIQ